MPYEFRNTGIVTVSKRQQVTVPLDDHGLPPAALEGLACDDEMPWRNLVPAARQLLRGARVWRWPRHVTKRSSEQFEIQLALDVRHQPAATGMQPTGGQTSLMQPFPSGRPNW